MFFYVLTGFENEKLKRAKNEELKQNKGIYFCQNHLRKRYKFTKLKAREDPGTLQRRCSVLTICKPIVRINGRLKQVPLNHMRNVILDTAVGPDLQYELRQEKAAYVVYRKLYKFQQSPVIIVVFSNVCYNFQNVLLIFLTIFAIYF